jgi:hypothetical protein
MRFRMAGVPPKAAGLCTARSEMRLDRVTLPAGKVFDLNGCHFDP